MNKREEKSVRVRGVRWGAIVLATAVLPLSCSIPGDQEPVDAVNEEGEFVVEAVAACTTCISLENTAQLGSEDGPGYLEVAMFGVVDSMGNYWVSQFDGPKVFSPEAEYLGQVGRLGEGPGEFRMGGDLFVDEAGNIHIFDPQLSRETVFSPSWELIKTVQLPGAVFQAVPLNGGRLLANFRASSPDKVGLPLHVIEGPKVIRSMGPTSGSHDMENYRLLARDAKRDVVLSMRNDEYLIKEWDGDGNLLRAFRRQDAWTDPVEEGGLGLGPETPPPPYVADLFVDSLSRAWVIYWLPRPDWQDHVEEFRYYDGSIGYRPEGGQTESVMYAVLEILDLEEARVLYRVESEELFGGVLTDGRVFGITHDEIGAPLLSIWSVDITPGR